MCGICGIATVEVGRREIAEKMLVEINHRGQDERGLWEDPWLTLGHNRLSIIDLSSSGRQPMVKGDWIIVFNGEIYNYKELREELRGYHGQVFQTETDTEVILAAWDIWGHQSLDKFRGMWSFAIYHQGSQELILSRDRFGIKPLYYFAGGNRFLFASEIKALLTDPAVPRQACLSVISDYLLAGFHDHRPETFYEGIKQLPPGHCLVLNARDRNFTVQSYYDLGSRIQGRKSTISDFDRALRESVRLHLRSDVPVGTCLSGGLDSSSVATLASSFMLQENAGPLQAITAKSGEPENDETEYARMVVEKAGLQWHVTQPSADDFREHWERCLWHQDEPAGGPSVFMQYWVMKAAHEAGIKVMLDGQGGDECLLGYERYYPSVFCYWLRHGYFSTAGRELLAASRNSKLSIRELLLYSLYFLVPAVRKARSRTRLRGLPSELVEETLARIVECGRQYYHVSNLQVAEINYYQLPHLLRYEDRNSMAWTVEARVPFVDYEVIETALTLTPEDKINQGFTKWALRCSMKEEMPEAITWRRNKIGFAAPTGSWLQRHREWMIEVIKNSLILRELELTTIPTNDNMFIFFFNLASWESLYRVHL